MKEPVVHIPARVGDARLGGPWDVVYPLTKLRAKYLGAHESCYPSVDFDLYSARRSGERGWANRIESIDLYATLLMNSRVSKFDVSALMGRVDRIGRALAAVPAGRNLADEDLSEESPVRNCLSALLAACRLDGFSMAKVTKLLCLKRPSLIPMLDGLVMQALYRRPPAMASGGDVFGDQAVDAIARFREVMRHGENLEALQRLSAVLSAEVAEALAMRGLGGPYPMLTPVRVLDNLLWFDWGGYEHFAFRWNQVTDQVEPS